MPIPKAGQGNVSPPISLRTRDIAPPPQVEKAKGRKVELDVFGATQLPVNGLDAGLDLDGTLVQVGPYAEPRAALSMEEIRNAPSPQRQELTGRYADFLGFIAGTRVGKTAVDEVRDAKVASGDFSVEAKGGRITLQSPQQSFTVVPTADGAKLEGKGGAPTKAQAREAALEIFSRLINLEGSAKSVDPVAAELYLHLLGPQGLLRRDGAPLPNAQRFASPKLIAWDFNGTVQDGDERVRPGMAKATDSLHRMGAVNVLTTSIDPEPSELWMREQGVIFGSSFGRAEVRPTEGDKQYEGVAHAHGLSAAEAQHRMVVIGDSSTDIPGDGVGGIFIHDRQMVPASAIEYLLHDLDRQGEGSFVLGLLKAAGGGLTSDQPKRLAVGPLELKVGLRMGESEFGAWAVPVIEEIKVLFSPGQVAQIASTPPADAEEERGTRLALDHLASTLDEADIPEVLQRVNPDHAQDAVAVVRQRLANDEEDNQRARKLAENLPAILSGPLSFNRAAGMLRHLARSSDEKVAREVVRAAHTFDQTSREAEPMLDRELCSFADQIQRLVRDGGAVNIAISHDDLNQAARILLRHVEAPIPLEPSRQAQLLEAFELALGDDRPQVAELCRIFAHNVEEALPDARQALEDRFAERRVRAQELSPIADLAVANAQRRAALHGQIRQALAQLDDRAS